MPRPHYNVGCGRVPLIGYYNLDLQTYPETEGHPDVTLHDVRHGFPEAQIASIRADQFLEHLTLAELAIFLVACREALAPGGEVRFGFPDIAKIAALCDAGRQGDVPARNGIPAISGIPTDLQTLNMAARDAWGHKTCLTTELVAECVRRAGFEVLWPEPAPANGLVIARRPRGGSG